MWQWRNNENPLQIAINVVQVKGRVGNFEYPLYRSNSWSGCTHPKVMRELVNLLNHWQLFLKVMENCGSPRGWE